MRVLQICCVPGPAGLSLEACLAQWRTLTDVAAATASAGLDVTVLLDGDRSDSVERDGVSYIQRPGARRPRQAAAFARIHRPDVIHMVGLEAPLVVRALCGTGIPVLAQDHANRPRRWMAPLARWGFARLAGVAFTSIRQAEPFLRARQLRPTTRVFAIPESSSHFTRGDKGIARRLSGLYGAPALLWVGHLDANKNPLLVLRALRRVLRELPEAHLWCAFGNAPLRPQVDAMLADDPRLQAHVHLLGKVDHREMEALYRSADVFVSASAREGSGYALIEALACGTPCVATDIPSFRALTGAGDVAQLVAASADMFANGIIREFALASDPGRHRAAQIRRHFDEHLSFPVIGRMLAEAYSSIARARASRCG